MRARSLRRILLGQGVLVSVLPFLLAAVLGAFWVLPQIRLELQKHQGELAQAVALQVDGYLVSAASVVNASALLADSVGGRRLVGRFLDAPFNQAPRLNALYAIDQDGHLAAVSLPPGREALAADYLGFDLSRHPLFQLVSKSSGSSWSETFLSVVGGGISVACAMPAGDLLIVGEVDLDQLTRFLGTITSQEEIAILVIDQKGQVIADRQGELTAQQLNVGNIPLVSDGLLSRDKRSGEFQLLGRRMVGSLAPVASIGWSILVARPLEEVYLSARTTGEVILISLLLAVCLSVAVSMLLTGKLARRFEALTAHARRVAGGEGSLSWPQANITEFQQLADSLEQMGVELHRREGELEQAQAYLLASLQQSPSGILIAEAPDGRVRLVNRAAEEILLGGHGEILPGTRLGELDSLPWGCFNVDGSIRQVSEFPLLQAIRTGRFCDHQEVRIRRPDGSERWLQVNATPIRNSTGEITGGISVFIDVTRRREWEERLRQAKEFTENLIRTANALIVVLDPSGRVVLLNEMASRVTGYRQDELVGRCWFDLLVGEADRRRARETFARYLESNRPDAVEYPIQCRERGERLIAWRTSPIREAEKIGGMLCFGIDVTEQRGIEQQLLHTQKLESLGVLAGGIAHDFNNILMSVLGNAELALMRLPAASPAVENLRQIETATGRAADLARQMLAYSGKGRLLVEPHDLNQIVEEMAHMLEVSISKKVRLRYDLMPHLPSVEVDATQVRQVVMNLVINASEAIGSRSGVVAIRTGVMDCDAAYLRDTWLDERLTEGLYVFLEVADTGCGMDRETVSRIFDPFFTTKFTGRGLGMAAVMGILRGHRGAIKVYSEPGRGTTFKVLLPASSKPAELFDPLPDDNGWHGAGLALLVDDEESVRAIGKTMLQELGFEVLTAEDGRQALEVYRQHRERIRFILLDLTMPHMNGEETFRELRRLDPGARVIITSGYNEQEVSEKFIGKGLAGCLQKPYRLSALRETIKSLLPSQA